MRNYINLLLFVVLMVLYPFTNGFLYPYESETRERKNLDGIWKFRTASKSDQEAGFRQQWYKQPLEQTGEVIPMPVPASYNDITQNKTIRDHVGWVWYEKEFFVPQQWQNDSLRVVLYFGSAHYYTIVWLNGVNVFNHSGGHLPFQGYISQYLKFSDVNRLTVALNNTLTSETIPQGKVEYTSDTSRYPPGYYYQTYTFDFFNYAGIHRSVALYTTPATYIDDVTVQTNIQNGNTGEVNYKINFQSLDKQQKDKSDPLSYVNLYDNKGKLVAQQKGLSGQLLVSNANFWWPYTMNPIAGYLYTLEIRLKTDLTFDIYRLNVGIRTVTWNATTLMINGKPVYIRGVGKHEDSEIRGKGLDFPLIAKDFNLLKWLGVNAFRTSHYPYSDEIMDFADKQGIMVIDETPAVNADNFDQQLLETHKQVLTELITRDKNRPSVIMWSLSNEPRSAKPAAGPYFKRLVEFTKTLDNSRPVTAVLSYGYSNDQAAQYMDILCVNRYFGWYSDTGRLEVIQKQVEYEYTNWYDKFRKPILISEYGADTIAGLHMEPAFVFTEEYQTDFMMQYFKAFDNLYKHGFFIGEMIWNFADFMTSQTTNRVVGNRKGVLTRDRQPKAAAHLLRARYWYLAARDNGTLIDSPKNQQYCAMYSFK